MGTAEYLAAVIVGKDKISSRQERQGRKVKASSLAIFASFARERSSCSSCPLLAPCSMLRPDADPPKLCAGPYPVLSLLQLAGSDEAVAQRVFGNRPGLQELEQIVRTAGF